MDIDFVEKVIQTLTNREDIYFEWIKDSELKKHGINPEELELPIRKTHKSAGYDFMIPIDVEIQPDQIVLVPTGVKAHMPDFLVLDLVLRSSSPLKVNIRMSNSLGVIDADYYNNPNNDGHIFFQIENKNEFPITLKKGDYIGQGIFKMYFKIKGDVSLGERTGGIGSTDEKGEE